MSKQVNPPRSMTLSMESMHRLHMQFIEKYISPNLYKQVPEIAALIKCSSSYEAHRYLQSICQEKDKEINNGGIDNSHKHAQSQTRSNHSDKPTAFKIATAGEQSMSFKPKTSVRRTLTNAIPSEVEALKEISKDNNSGSDNGHRFEGNNYIKPHDNLVTPANHHSSTQSEAGYRPYPEIPKAQTTPHKQQSVHSSALSNNDTSLETRKRLVKDVIRKISKVFQDNRVKIERYGKSSNIDKEGASGKYQSQPFLQRHQINAINIKKY